MKTIVFVCSYEPYKVVISMPNMVSGFSVEDIREATKYCDKPLPNIPQGYFTIINRSNNCQVALFKFKVTAGCRTTESRHHFKLPLPNPIHRNIKKLTKEPNIRVGFPYVYSHDQPYTVQNGTVTLSEPTLPTEKTIGSESSRTTIMVSSLRQMFRNLLDIDTTQDHHQVCPFTGGGDIFIQTKNSTSAAVIHELTPEDDDGSTPFSVATYVTTPQATAPTTPQATTPTAPQATASTAPQATAPTTPQATAPTTPQATAPTTPPKVGELRCGAAENKMTAGQSDKAVTLQVQANMMLLASCLLRKSIEKNPDDAESINLLTCYGLQLGSTYPLKIIKLTIDFHKCKCEYEEQFILYPCSVYPAYIDIALNYIVERLQ